MFVGDVTLEEAKGGGRKSVASEAKVVAPRYLHYRSCSAIFRA
jgi:hypothetical protein